jgi:hypothetical protein
MKKMILTLAIAVSSLAVFAGEVNVSSTVLRSFSTDFTDAKEVKWTEANDYFKASFVLNDQHVTAYYSIDGVLFGTTRNISSLDLPLSLQANLKKEYSGYWISDLFEVSGTEGTQYFITLEQADKKVILRSDNSSKWSTFKKLAKA